jgi:hypothetical protein
MNSSQNSNSGFFGAITNVFKKATNTLKNSISNSNSNKNMNSRNIKKNNTAKNNSAKNSLNYGFTASPKNTSTQAGGVAPVNFRYSNSMQQPSEKIMEWATTAGLPRPPASEMRGVAHGGKRKTRKAHRKTKMRKINKRKTNRRK